MWYFTWILGLGLAVAFAILNGIWHEHNDSSARSGPSARRKANDTNG